MRNKKPHKTSPTAIKRKLFGKKIKKQDLAIPDYTVNFFEDVPLYRRKKSRSLLKKQPTRTRKTK